MRGDCLQTRWEEVAGCSTGSSRPSSGRSCASSSGRGRRVWRTCPGGPGHPRGNHLSFSDSFFMPLHVRRKVTFLAKCDYFTGRASRAGSPVVLPGGGGAGRPQRRQGRRLRWAPGCGCWARATCSGSTRGHAVTRRPPLPRQDRCRPHGAQVRVPVIPVAMVGTFEMSRPARRLPKRGIRPGVRFGEPLDFSRYSGCRRTARCSAGDRRDHVFAHGAVGAGVRRQVRRQRKVEMERAARAAKG